MWNYLKKILLLIFLLIILSTFSVSADFELTGKVERGDNTYLSNQEASENIITDYYNYEKMWFKLKNKLTYPNYYYLKLDYYDKKYKQESIYDNHKINLSGNYTKNFSENYRNKFYFKINNVEYINKESNSYTSYTLNYQFRHQVNKKNQYTLNFKKRNYTYFNDYTKDYNVDSYKVNWKRDISEKLEIELGYQYKKEYHFYNTESNNKVGHRISFDFTYDI